MSHEPAALHLVCSCFCPPTHHKKRPALYSLTTSSHASFAAFYAMPPGSCADTSPCHMCERARHVKRVTIHGRLSTVVELQGKPPSLNHSPNWLPKAVGNGLQVVRHTVVQTHAAGVHTRTNSQLLHVAACGRHDTPEQQGAGNVSCVAVSRTC